MGADESAPDLHSQLLDSEREVAATFCVREGARCTAPSEPNFSPALRSAVPFGSAKRPTSALKVRNGV